MTKTTYIRELARRRGGGLDVLLRWDPENDSVSIVVEDDQTGETLEFDVPGDDALDAFAHPYAYAPKS